MVLLMTPNVGEAEVGVRIGKLRMIQRVVEFGTKLKATSFFGQLMIYFLRTKYPRSPARDRLRFPSRCFQTWFRCHPPRSLADS